MLLFDVVIPTYNNLNELKKCLDCFENQTIHSFHVWICVDGSTDGTVDYLSKTIFSFPLSFLEHSDKKNHGRGPALNLSLPYISAKYVLFIDSDFTFRSDFLKNHLRLLTNNNSTISIGKILYKKGNIWRDYDMTRGMHKFTNDAEIPYKCMVTSNTSMPSRIFLELNGFDENITTYGGEDTDIACTIWQNYRCKVILNKQATVYGRLEKTLEFALQQKEEFARTNLKYLIKKHPDAKTLFRVDVLQSLAGRILYSIIPLNFFMYLAQSSIIPNSIRIKIVHLLVFYHFYKGFHSKL